MFGPLRTTHLAVALALAAPAWVTITAPPARAQAPAAASRQLGTVKSVSGDSITISTAAGAPITVTIAPGAPVLQLPPGSTDLKTATPAAASDIAVGDRILATGKPGDSADVIVASRIILMKSSDLAARNQAQQADWQRRGVGGIVKSVDGQVINISSGTRTIKIQTTGGTIFRRYADDSVNFQDAKASNLDQIHVGDQLTARGAHSDDNLAVTAEEVVTGSFANLSGIVTAVDPALGTVSLKDLATKRVVTVKVTSNSDLRKLPSQAAAMFAARNNPSAAAGGAAGGGAAGAGGGGAGQSAASGGGGSRYGGGDGAGGGRARAGMDLSRMLARLPAETLAELKPGEAVMLVATQGRGSESYTAITLLSGVEQLLSATPAGGQPITLSPWNLGTPEAGGGGPGPQ